MFRAVLSLAALALVPLAAAQELTPSLVFQPMPTMTACQPNSVQWLLMGVQDSREYALHIYAYNIGVDQSAPAPTPSAKSTSSPAAAQPPAVTSSAANSGTLGQVPAQGTAKVARDSARYMNLAARADNINITVSESHNANVSDTWYANVPQGRYRLMAFANTTKQVSAISDVFSVVTRTNTSCIIKEAVDESKSTAVSSSKTSSTHASSKSATSGSASATTTAGGSGAAAAGVQKKSSGISGGAIAGIVIGVLAALALAALLFFCLRRRKRSAANSGSEGVPPLHLPRQDHEKDVFAAVGPPPTGPATGGYDAEMAQPVHAPAPTRSGRQSAMSTESENPFSTAPSTPVEEMQPSAFGTASTVGAGMAGMGAYAAGSHGEPRNDFAPYAGPNAGHAPAPHAAFAAAPSHAPYGHQDDAYAAASFEPAYPAGTYDDDPVYSNDDYPPSAFGARLPVREAPQAEASLPNTPGTSSYSNIGTSHHSQLSSQSALEGMIANAPVVPTTRELPHPISVPASTTPPSSFSPATPVSPTRPRTDRKGSLRRKPVPHLNAEEEEAAKQSSSEEGSDQEHSKRTPSDKFNLNRGLSFKLMPDPPMHQD